MYCPECELRVADDKQTLCPVCRGALRPDQEQVAAGGGRLDGYKSSDDALDFDPTDLGLDLFGENENQEDVRKLARLWREQDEAADLEGVLAEALTVDGEVDPEINEELFDDPSNVVQGETDDPAWTSEAGPVSVATSAVVSDDLLEHEVSAPDLAEEEIDFEGDLGEVLDGLDQDKELESADPRPVAEVPGDEMSTPISPTVSAANPPTGSRRLIVLCLLLVVLVAGGWFAYQEFGSKPQSQLSSSRSPVSHQPADRQSSSVVSQPSKGKQPVAEQPEASSSPEMVRQDKQPLPENEQQPAEAIAGKPVESATASSAARESGQTAALAAKEEKVSEAARAADERLDEVRPSAGAGSVAQVGEVKPVTVVAAAEAVQENVTPQPLPQASAGSVAVEGGETASPTPPSDAVGIAETGKVAAADNPVPEAKRPAVEGRDGASEASFKPYAVHIGSFKSQGRAQRHCDNLRAKNFAAYIFEVDLKSKGVWFRVLVPGGDTREAGKKVQQALSEAFPREESRVIKVQQP